VREEAVSHVRRAGGGRVARATCGRRPCRTCDVREEAVSLAPSLGLGMELYSFFLRSYAKMDVENVV
jgi:hypothetical protein